MEGRLFLVIISLFYRVIISVEQYYVDLFQDIALERPLKMMMVGHCDEVIDLDKIYGERKDADHVTQNIFIRYNDWIIMTILRMGI